MRNIPGIAAFSLRALILPTILMTGGCSSMLVLNEYRGPATVPDKQLSILDASLFAGVVSVDGKRIHQPCAWNTHGKGCEIRLMPGKHQFVVGYVGAETSSSFNGVSVSQHEVLPYLAVVSLEMKAGEKYELYCLARKKSPQTHYMEVAFGVPGHKYLVKAKPERYIKQKQ